MSGGRSHLFIINPAAGQGGAAVSEGEISRFCRARGADFEIRRTSAPGDAGRIASAGVKEGFARIVSVGGDGTSSEVARAVAGTGVIMGVVPAGSGNDFPSACGVPSPAEDALEAVFADSRLKVDAGSLDGRGFVNGLGIGMDGAIAAGFPRFRFLGGFAGYLAAAGAAAVTFRGFAAAVRSPGGDAGGRCLLAGVSNGPSQGGFRISPAAKPDDGLLDFHFICDMPPPLRVLRLVSVMAGAAGGGWISRFQAASAVIETETDLPAHMDGEPFVLEAGEHEISIRKGALSVLSPAGSV
ncbi:MAG: YegS/Rv2252/BmrU family lipid kinase [Candidatus Dadabacteria bacterium]|nr:YegS/Rv2252/BmrU family lipid kinase [Candidatus Dadabacteria bacterium]